MLAHMQERLPLCMNLGVFPTYVSIFSFQECVCTYQHQSQPWKGMYMNVHT